MISPVTPIQSPRDSSQNRSKSGVEADGANSWIRPVWSASVPNASFPCTRRNMSRPAIAARWPVSVPGSNDSKRPANAAAVVSTS